MKKLMLVFAFMGVGMFSALEASNQLEKGTQNKNELLKKNVTEKEDFCTIRRVKETRTIQGENGFDVVTLEVVYVTYCEGSGPSQ